MSCSCSNIIPHSLEKVKEIKVPTQVNSASLSPDKSMFVCGGEDLKVYKYDYDSGNEIGEKSFISAADKCLLLFKEVKSCIFR
jgi:WD40 repeat protein